MTEQDIVAELRDAAKSRFEYENRATGLSILLEEAADEIERLRQEAADENERHHRDLELHP